MYYEFDRLNGGVPVLFLHGWGGSVESFRGAAEFFKAKNIPTLNLDFSGFGRSFAPQSVYGVGDYAAEVKTLLGALGIGKVNVAAHSFGGRVALVLAARFHGLVGKLLITAGAGIKPRRGLIYAAKVLRYKLYKKLGGDVSKFGSPDFKALASGVMRGTFVKVVNEDLTPLLGKISCPTLLIWGDKDRDTPLSAARVFNRKIKSSGLIVFKGAGHYAYAERYGDFNRIAHRFFAGDEKKV